jgi:hypothetical protein
VADPAESALPNPAVSRQTAQLSQEAKAAREDSRRSAERLIEVEQILAESQASVFALEESESALTTHLAGLEQRLDRADRLAAAMKSSLSWRVTAPLRALKRLRQRTGS